MKQSDWLQFEAENCDWSRKVTPLPDLTQVPLLAKAELNCEIYKFQLKKMMEKSNQFLSTEQFCEPKRLDFALNIAGVEKMPSVILAAI